MKLSTNYTLATLCFMVLAQTSLATTDPTDETRIRGIDSLDTNVQPSFLRGSSRELESCLITGQCCTYGYACEVGADCCSGYSCTGVAYNSDGSPSCLNPGLGKCYFCQ